MRRDSTEEGRGGGVLLYDFNHQGRVRERWWDTNFFWFPLEDHTIDNISLVIYPVYPVFGTKFACISCIL